MSNRKDGKPKATNSNNRSGRKGVHRSTKGKWIAQIGVGYQRKYIGSFDSIEAAYLAYKKAYIRYFPSHAQLEQEIEDVQIP